jgi:hypothetical protein
MDWLRHGLCHDDAIKWVAAVQRQVGDHVFGVPIVKAIRNVPLTFQTSLFQYSVECPWREVIGWLSGDCNSSELGRVLGLAMTAMLGDLVPSVALDPPDDPGNLHPA